MRTTTATTTATNAAPARPSEFESVGAILARMFERRGDAFKRSLEAARSDGAGRVERREDRPPARAYPYGLNGLS